jgi:flagellar biosynthesis protein FlhF
MNLRTFRAAKMRDVLQQVKAELGPDAVIVSTREVSRGLLGREIEVTAAVETRSGPASGPAPVAGPVREDPFEQRLAPLTREIEALKLKTSSMGGDEARVLRAEIRALRELLTTDGKSGRAREDLDALAGRRELTRPSRERVVALVGPTGVGKTTTIAKLSARAALIRSLKVAIITTDAYRVGGEDQLRIFADLIGVPLFPVRDIRELPRVVATLSGFERIFIDTAGRSPTATPDIYETLDALLKIRPTEIHLTLAADSRPETIDRWVNCYGRDHLDRLLFTKVDEARDAAEVVRAPVRFDLPVSYLSFGQCVPEDVVEANREVLLRFAQRGLQREGVAA